MRKITTYELLPPRIDGLVAVQVWQISIYDDEGWVWTYLPDRTKIWPFADNDNFSENDVLSEPYYPEE